MNSLKEQIITLFEDRETYLTERDIFFCMLNDKLDPPSTLSVKKVLKSKKFQKHEFYCDIVIDHDRNVTTDNDGSKSCKFPLVYYTLRDLSPNEKNKT